MQSGKLIVLTGPSGVGKGTLVRSLLSSHRELYLSVSATTRTPRPGEIEEEDYYFVSRQQFESMVEENQLLEWAEYAGNYYGTPRVKVEEQIQQGKFVLLEIEVIGARKIKQTFPDAFLLFILPPSLRELERRLRDRGDESEESMIKRLKRAKEEIEVSSEFDVQIINDKLEIALKEIENAIWNQQL